MSPEHVGAAAIFHIVTETFGFSCQSHCWLLYFGRWLLGYFYGSNNRDISLHCILRRRGPWKWFFLWKESSHSLSPSLLLSLIQHVLIEHMLHGVAKSLCFGDRKALVQILASRYGALSILLKLRAFVSSEVKGSNHISFIGHTSSVSLPPCLIDSEPLVITAFPVIPTAGRCLVLTDFIVLLGRQGRCSWIKDLMQEWMCSHIVGNGIRCNLQCFWARNLAGVRAVIGARVSNSVFCATASWLSML